MNETKKILIILGVVVLFVLTIVFLTREVEEEQIPRENPEELVARLETALASESNTLVYLGITTCPACNMFGPVLEGTVERYNLKYIHFDLDLMDSSYVFMVYDMLDLEQPSVPFIAVVNNTGIIDTQIGYMEPDAFSEFLKKNNIIEE